MYDAIVIGARCAGSPTAMLLARKGYRVLLVDRATFPSDSPKNHYVRQVGVAKLTKWGLLDRVAATGCPPVRKQMVDFGDFPMMGYPIFSFGVDAEYGPRRIVLDKLLVDAAAESGAEVREGFSVQEIVVEDGRVVGIKGRSKGGESVTERAHIVIGADGHHSIVARTVQAPTYNERPALTCGYYSYWSDLPCDALEVYFRPAPAFLLAFPTNYGLTCVATQVPVREFDMFRANIEETFFQKMDLAPELAERVRNGKREERFYGSADLENFFRKPFGAEPNGGWALVGDAGYHKDPITALGVSDAFRDADLLAEAVDSGLSGLEPMEGALAEYERKRNEAALPEYENACMMASFYPFPPQLFEMRAAIRDNQEAINRFMSPS
jgi:flavin-dependent dehydrogenase